jgi:hypothetical protein
LGFMCFLFQGPLIFEPWQVLLSLVCHLAWTCALPAVSSRGDFFGQLD